MGSLFYCCSSKTEPSKSMNEIDRKNFINSSLGDYERRTQSNARYSKLNY